jgi:recombination protein RecT
MAQLELMPSDVSGEAYVLPYKGQAQFQLGYQGLVTLFYRSGAKDITTEIVYKNDTFSYRNGEVMHEPDIFGDDRGEAIGAYVIVTVQSGGKVTKVMSKKDILAIGKKFSKSFGTNFSPWDAKNDPELWMWKKTVLKQAAKLVPKNSQIVHAIAEDNQDSIIADRLEDATKKSEALTMGKLIKNDDNDQKAGNQKESEQKEDSQSETAAA